MRYNKISRTAMIFSSSVLVILMGCETSEDGLEQSDPEFLDSTSLDIEEGDVQTAEMALTNPAAPYSISYDNSICTSVRVTFTADAYKGVYPYKYRLYRYTSSTGWVTAAISQPTNPSRNGVIYDGTIIPFNTKSYRYGVKLYYKVNGTTYASQVGYGGWLTPQGCKLPHQISVNAFPFSPNDISLPYGRPVIEDIMFDETPGAMSLANWMVEQTMGVGNSGSATQNKVEITGLSTNWTWLNRTLASFPGSKISAMMDYIESQGTADYYRNHYPSDYRMWLFNSQTGGGFETGEGNFHIGADALSYGGFSSIAHEIGHSFGLDHNPAVYCGTDVVPEDIINYKDECSVVSTYGNWLDPMSGAQASRNHYNGYDKWVMQMLSGYAETVELTSSSPSVTRYLYDSTSAYFNYQQLLIVKLDNNDSDYVLEYRRPLGFNATTVPGHPVPPKGVYIYMRRGAYGDGTGTLQLYKNSALTEPLVLVSGGTTEFYDAHRGIRFKLLSGGTNSSARVRVTNESL